MDEFKELILKHIFDVEDVKDVPTYELSDEDWDNVYKLSEERYQKWEWNFGKSPSYNLKQSHKFPSGLLDVRLNVKKGVIEECTIFGDSVGVGNVRDIEEKLVGVRQDRKSRRLNSSHVASSYAVFC